MVWLFGTLESLGMIVCVSLVILGLVVLLCCCVAEFLWNLAFLGFV